MILDGRRRSRSPEVDPFVRNSCASEKVQCAPILWKLNRVEFNAGWPSVLYLKESFYVAKVKIGENSTAQVCTAQECIAQECMVQVCTLQVRFDQECIAQVCTPQICMAQVCMA